ncbi:MAG: hypothetical protein RIB45_01260 [Marivibrio sp.]|uniref:ATP-binding protein n=1 Tax=Marivibrio sp. TaxID=2039719 RepID=UPI0032EF1C47
MSERPRFIGGFRAAQAPRFEGGDEDPYLFDNRHALFAALSAAIQGLADPARRDCLIEVRISADPDIGLLTIDLVLWSTDADGGSLLSLIGALLPSDYAWRPLDEAQLNACWRGDEVFISRLVRRLQFVELPGDQVEWVAGAADDEAPGSGGEELIGRRRLPEIGDEPGGPAVQPLCLPAVSAVVSHTRSVRRLYGELLRAAPACLSVTIAPADPSHLVTQRAYGGFWRRFSTAARTADGLLHAADAADPTGGAFDRYLLPDAQLCRATVRCAADDPARSAVLAHHLAAQYGGAHVFEPLPPTRPAPIAAIPDLWVEAPCADWVPEDWREAAQEERERLRRLRIEPPEDVEPLHVLLAMPYLYTDEEVAQLAALPFADADGLPGVDTKPPPPFIGTVAAPSPVVDPRSGALAPPPETGRMRIGIAQGGGASTAAPLTLDDLSGSMARRYRGAHWHTMPIENLNKHAFIVGSTGSGKTMSTLFLVRELTRFDKPFMVIEPVKTEYYDELSPHAERLGGRPLVRRNFEGDGRGGRSPDFLAFDPMRIPTGVTVMRHISYLKSCFEAAFPLDPVQALLLESGLLSYYTNPAKKFGCGLNKFSLGGPKTIRKITNKKTGETRLTPSLSTFFDHFLKYFIPAAFPADGSKGGASRNDIRQNFKDMFDRRFNNLRRSLVGEASKLADQLYMENPTAETADLFPRLLETNTIIELDAIPDGEQKSLVMAFLMTRLFAERQAADLMRRRRIREIGAFERADPLQHVLVIEEAHRLLANTGGGGRGELAGESSKAKAVGLFVDMLAEIRALGQGIVIVEQIPTKIVPEAVKNTNLKIMLRVTSKDDRDYLGEAMNFTEAQNRFVTALRAKPGEGVDMVVFEEGVDLPLMLTLPLPDRRPPTPWLYDELFASDGGDGP